MPRLPLFPLGTVLVPGARLPLQIFEPRYIELVNDLVARPEPERCFGIIAIRAGHEVGEGAATELYDVGCEARIDALASAPTTPGGPVLHLVATGTRPFRLDTVLDDAPTSYATAEVTWLAEPAPDPAERDRLADEVRAAYAGYLTVAGAVPTPLSDHAIDLPHEILAAAPLTLDDRQRVLEAAGLAARLRMLRDVVRHETELVKRFHAVPAPPSIPRASPN